MALPIAGICINSCLLLRSISASRFGSLNLIGEVNNFMANFAAILADVASRILELEKQFGPFEYAIGHSLGAMAVLNSIKRGLKVNKAVTIGSGDV